ncbi:MAG: glycosyltransferase family 2 protein [Candidatus Paceibacterales bacterium]
MDLSIIILSYKSRSHLAVLLPSIFLSQTKYNYEIIVVDNGSNDGTAELVKTLFSGREKVFYVQNENTGFAHGNNLGITKSSSRYILLLNPDTKL